MSKQRSIWQKIGQMRMDADGLIYLTEVGFFGEVRVKGFHSM